MNDDRLNTPTDAPQRVRGPGNAIRNRSCDVCLTAGRDANLGARQRIPRMGKMGWACSLCKKDPA